MSTEAPPSYEDVMASLNKRLGPHPKAEEILTAIEQLPRYEKVIISEHPIEIIPLSSEQERQFTTGAAIAMSSSDGHKRLTEEASRINTAVQNIQRIFLNLTLQLSGLDAYYTNPQSGPFAPRLVRIHEDYKATLARSRALAIKIALYSEKFDKVIIPVVSNETATNEQKDGVLTEYIKDAEQFERESLEVQTDFDRVESKLNSLAGEFGTWAKEKRDAQNQRLQEVENQIVILNSELASLRLALVATGAAASLAVPITGVIAWFAGPFAPFIILAGLVAAAASTAAVIALQVSIDLKQNSLNEYEKEREALKNSIQHIDTTQESMTNLAREDLKAFGSSLNILQATWRSAVADVQKIQGWLKTGQGLQFIPELLKDHFDDSVNLYKAMAVYLENYAKGTII